MSNDVATLLAERAYQRNRSAVPQSYELARSDYETVVQQVFRDPGYVINVRLSDVENASSDICKALSEAQTIIERCENDLQVLLSMSHETLKSHEVAALEAAIKHMKGEEP